MIPLVVLLYFLLGRNGRLLDLNYSARPLAREIQQADPNALVVAEFNVRRDLVYGLAFYRDQPIVSYTDGGVPEGEHLVVFPTREEPLLEKYLKGRFTQHCCSIRRRGYRYTGSILEFRDQEFRGREFIDQ